MLIGCEIGMGENVVDHNFRAVWDFVTFGEKCLREVFELLNFL